MDAPDEALILARTPGLHAGRLRDDPELLAAPARLLRASPARLRSLMLGEAAIAWLLHPDIALIAEDRRWLQDGQIHLVPWGAEAYPGRLAEIPDPPLLLFVHGPPEHLARPQIAIVGTRHPTPAGRETALSFAACLAQAGVTITSGLARGIDAAAHLGALEHGRTLAIVGTGLDSVYPPEHAVLQARILAAGGAVASEFPRGTPPLKGHFPQRNRLISGLALATVVVEAAHNSGSLITARSAAAQGRDVFVVPGSIHNVQSRGCHALIREGAQLVESADQILQDLKIPFQKQWVDPTETPSSPPVATPGRLDKAYEILLDGLGFAPVGVDELVARTGLDCQTLAAMLLVLELSGVVAMHSGGRYQRVRRVATRQQGIS